MPQDIGIKRVDVSETAHTQERRGKVRVAYAVCESLREQLTSDATPIVAFERTGYLAVGRLAAHKRLWPKKRGTQKRSKSAAYLALAGASGGGTHSDCLPGSLPMGMLEEESRAGGSESDALANTPSTRSHWRFGLSCPTASACLRQGPAPPSSGLTDASCAGGNVNVWPT